MTPLDRVNKVLSMPRHRKPPVAERVSNLESLVATLVKTITKLEHLIQNPYEDYKDGKF